MTGAGLPPQGFFHGLSARLLLLTAAFVLLSEALLFFPGLTQKRRDLLREKGREVELVVLAAEGSVSPETQRMLRRAGQFHAIRVHDGTDVIEILPLPEGVVAGPVADLRNAWSLASLRDSATLLFDPTPPPVHLWYVAPGGQVIEAVVGQLQIAAELRRFAEQMLKISLAISAFTGLLVYLVIHRLMVQPMRRLTAAITAFRDNPDAPVPPLDAARQDEIGLASREFSATRAELRAALWQRSRLAALGAAVAKISHDLRGILSTALLVADRLDRSEDPNVRRSAPLLVDAIERATALSRSTLDFAREGRPALALGPVRLAQLVEEAAIAAGARPGSVLLAMPQDQTVTADATQLLRVFVNLMRNAFEAGARNLQVQTSLDRGATLIDVADDGPGVAERVQANLFKPFGATTRQDGTGLGLAIARDVMRAHGGDIALAETGPQGSIFRLTLPDSLADSLPDAEDTPPRRAMADPPEGRGGGGVRVGASRKPAR
jgi:signal transduction histidine kinase